MTALALADLERLARDLAATPAAGDEMPFSLPEGVTHEAAERLTLRFEVPVDAAQLARAFGWARPFAYSADVHHRSWQVGLYERELDDPHNRRIALSAPRLGDWTVRVQLEGRPEGDLPGVVCGASSAYDLERVTVRVVRLVLIDATL